MWCHQKSRSTFLIKLQLYNLLKDRKIMIFKVFFQCWPVDWSMNKKASVLSWLCVSKLFKVVQSIFLHCSNNIAILQMFAECHHQIKSIRRNTLYNTSGNEEIIVQNLISYLSGRLQDITTTFRRSQNDYLKSKSWFFYRPATVDSWKNDTANQGNLFNTHNMTNPTILSLVKMEYV